MQLYRHYGLGNVKRHGWQEAERTRDRLSKEVDDYLKENPNYNYLNDSYLGFSIGDNRNLAYKELRLYSWKKRLKEANICTSKYFCEAAATDLFEYYDLHQDKTTETWDSSRISGVSVTLDIVGIPLSFVGVGRLKPTSKVGSTILFWAGITDSSVSLATADHPMKQLITAGSYVPIVGALFNVNLLVWDLSEGISHVPYVPPIPR
jgi:hypothetical protein